MRIQHTVHPNQYWKFSLQQTPVLLNIVNLHAYINIPIYAFIYVLQVKYTITIIIINNILITNLHW